VDARIIIPCPGCRVGLRFPSDQGSLVVRCPRCGAEFEWQSGGIPAAFSPTQIAAPTPTGDRRKRRFSIAALALLALVVGIAVTSYSRHSGTRPPASRATVHTPQWVAISYRDLVDMSVITHSGKTVGELIGLLRGGRNASESGELQPFLETFSFVANEIVEAGQTSGGQPMVSAISEYPPGAPQPAWAALLREGRYQVFIGDGRARVFLQGQQPVGLFERDHGVIRHPLLAAMERGLHEQLQVEIHAFENDYATQTLRLDLAPLLRTVGVVDLQPKKTALPIAGLSRLLARAGALEAAEIDDAGQLRLYAHSGSGETLAKTPQTIADLAVVYRAVFYNGQNPPYISLDQHEDNRRAKVNFGGLLEDTHVGSVVLEADKLFKTLSTGLDPNSRTSVVASIRATIPAFQTSNERDLRDDQVSAGDGRQTIRFWFYPDKIRTVTDGTIAAVESCQFFADAERMGDERPLGAAQRETLAHLNTNFEEYAHRFVPFKELLTVGRLMAIVNWLHSSAAATRVDLDDLLGVELPAFETQRATNKMLAVSAVATSGEGLREERGEVTVVLLDSLLNQESPTVTDDDLLNRALAVADLRDREDLLPASVIAARHAHEVASNALNARSDQLERLGRRIDTDRTGLDRTNEAAVLAFNALVGRYEALRRTYNAEVEAFNAESDRLSATSTSMRTIASVGGGINLEPQSFAPPVVAPQSPRLAAVRRAAARPNAPGSSLMRSEGTSNATSSVIDARWRPASLPSTTMSEGPAGETMYRLRTPGYFVDAVVRPQGQPSTLATSQYPAEVIIEGSVQAGQTVVLRRGRPIQGTPERPVWTAR
jgi:hypothetical protein